MSFSTFFVFLSKGVNSPNAQLSSLAGKDSPDIAVLEAHYERARRYLREAPDLSLLEARMRELERRNP